MKVALFGNSTWCLYNFRRELIEELIGRGHEVHAIAPHDATYDDRLHDSESYRTKLIDLGAVFHPVPLTARGKNPLREAASLLSLYRTLRRIAPEVVLSFTIKCNLYTGFCRKLLRFHQVANVPGLGEAFARPGALRTLVSFMYRAAFRDVGAVFFQNREDLDYCLQQRLVPSHCARLIPGSGVSLAHFAPMPRAENTPRTFLMFGRLLPQKGYHEFIAAARRLKKRFGDKIEFLIQGFEDKNRPESAELLLAIQQAVRDGVVRYLPSAVDVRPTLRMADVVVLPSAYNEGIPRSLLEAMACGKPIITSDWKGCRETVQTGTSVGAHGMSGANGTLIPPRNEEALVAAILSFMALDAATLRAMGAASREFAVQRYDQRIVLQAYLSQLPAPAARIPRTRTADRSVEQTVELSRAGNE